MLASLAIFVRSMMYSATVVVITMRYASLLRSIWLMRSLFPMTTCAEAVVSAKYIMGFTPQRTVNNRKIINHPELVLPNHNYYPH